VPCGLISWLPSSLTGFDLCTGCWQLKMHKTSLMLSQGTHTIWTRRHLLCSTRRSWCQPSIQGNPQGSSTPPTRTQTPIGHLLHGNATMGRPCLHVCIQSLSSICEECEQTSQTQLLQEPLWYPPVYSLLPHRIHTQVDRIALWIIL
jgi:hypothetical protein